MYERHVRKELALITLKLMLILKSIKPPHHVSPSRWLSGSGLGLLRCLHPKALEKVQMPSNDNISQVKTKPNLSYPAKCHDLASAWEVGSIMAIELGLKEHI